MTDDDWHPMDSKSIGEIVHEFAVVRGDLSEQYARDQLEAVIAMRIERAQREAWEVAAQRRSEARRYYVAWQVARMRARALRMVVSES